MPTLNETSYWAAVESRDTRFNDAFVYAVRSTGIYCRPGCPSRRPQRHQVAFFASAAEATQAGYRACKRCQPQEAVVDSTQALVAQICRYLTEETVEPVTLAVLSARTGLSPSYLQRTFKRVVGISPRQYAAAQRLGQFKARLKAGETVTDALYNAGFNSSSRLYESAASQLGMTPATYRRGGKGVALTYSIVPCALGWLLVAATARGLSAVSLGDSAAELEAALATEFPAASRHRDDAGLSHFVTAILAYLNQQSETLQLPLDVRATAFQWRVWQALQAIPYGRTLSYRTLAELVGQPTATRAVARACATNPVALVIPCHRIVREDGSLGGYRWGLARKQTLLAQEQAAQTALNEQ